MAEPAVVLSLRTDGAGPGARGRALRNVVAITVRPSFAPADLALLKREPTTPVPTLRKVPAVRRAEPAKGRNTIRSAFLAAATRELYERLGDSERRVENGSVVLRWDLGEGDGIVVARKSTEEAKSGETIGAQLQAMLQYCEACGQKPRIVVAVLNLSGAAHFDDRLDFNEVFESFDRGEISWVLFRAMDRLARSMTWTALFLHYLQSYGIGLHIAQLRKQIDLSNPHERVLLYTLAMGAELEAASSGERMSTALHAQMRDAGKGWGKSGGFGFTRDEENFIVVQETEWGVVILIHELYARLRSIADVQRTLEHDFGIRLGQGTVHKILRDERYVTGMIKTKDPGRPEGFRVDVIHLPRPVPRALWEDNQILLEAKRGKATRTPEGHLVTRGIPVYHARCMNQDDPRRSGHQLKSIRRRDGSYRFFHAAAGETPRAGYPTPDSCRGYSLEADVVERAVIRGVRAMLEGHDVLHRAIALGRGNREPAEGGGLFTPDDRKRLGVELRRLERYRAGLWQRHLDRIRQGVRTDSDRLQQELDIVEQDLADLRRQVALDEQLHRRGRKPTPIPPDINALLTEEPPPDPERRLRRWAIVHELVSHVVVDDTDDGVSIELWGPLVPETDDAATWDPLDACAPDTTAPVRRGVPEPFRYRPIPERLVHAYRWRSTSDCFAADRFTVERMIDTFKLLVMEYPTGPIFGVTGVGAARWRVIAARRRLPAAPMVLYRAAADRGATPASLIRELVGARAAVVQGRVPVESRADAVCVIEAAIRDGFAFSAGWRDRASVFGRDRPYSFAYVTLRAWAKKFAGGDLTALVVEAQARADPPGR